MEYYRISNVFIQQILKFPKWPQKQLNRVTVRGKTDRAHWGPKLLLACTEGRRGVRKASHKRVCFRQEHSSDKCYRKSFLTKVKHLGTENTQYCTEIVSIRQKGSSGSRKTPRKIRKGKSHITETLPYRCWGARKIMPSHLYQMERTLLLQGRLRETTKLEVEKEKAENSKQNGWGPGPRKR